VKRTAKELLIALSEAASAGKTAAVEKLVAQGVDPNKTAEGYIGPALVLAVNSGHEGTARWLIGRGVKRPPRLLTTAVYSNAMWPPKFEWLVRELIEGGANLNRGGGPGDSATAMHLFRDAALLELALAHGGKLNVKDDEGATPLHWAARTAPEAYIEALLDKGADLDAKDKKGKTPLAYAKALGKYGKDTVKLLQERAGIKPVPKKGSWQKVEDDLVKRATKAIAAFAKKHTNETFQRFALDCNSGYDEVLLALQPADAKPSWSTGDWKHSQFANIELDVEALGDETEGEPFMTMACRALMRLEKEKAFAPLARTKKFAVLALDHDEDDATATKRLARLRR